ncbi:endonuclease/exonuclease/phosphatase family protein [Candidatus Nitrospira bockiana]
MRILTLNLQGYEDKHGAWHVRRDVILQVLRERRPDLVALQAVAKDPKQHNGADQAGQLADRLPEYKAVHFVAAADDGQGKQKGSAWLSRLPLDHVDACRLPVALPPGPDHDREPRLVLAARLGSPAVSVFNCHFSWVYPQAVANVEAALPFIHRMPEPWLMLGDFNTPPDTDLLRRLAAEGWTDIWAQLRPHDPGYTFESNAPDKRIDYVWAHRSCASRVHAIELVTAPPNPVGARLSDHLGLLVTLGR